MMAPHPRWHVMQQADRTPPPTHTHTHIKATYSLAVLRDGGSAASWAPLPFGRWQSAPDAPLTWSADPMLQPWATAVQHDAVITSSSNSTGQIHVCLPSCWCSLDAGAQRIRILVPRLSVRQTDKVPGGPCSWWQQGVGSGHRSHGPSQFTYLLTWIRSQPDAPVRSQT